MRFLLPALLLSALACGCVPLGSSASRPATISLAADEGRWRVEARGAVLDLGDWQIRIPESRVAETAEVPLLEQLVLEIVNTSEAELLIVEPEEISVRDFAGRGVYLGPKDTVLLRYRDRLELRYAPGLRAEPLPHPFQITVTVFRRPRFGRPSSVTLELR